MTQKHSAGTDIWAKKLRTNNEDKFIEALEELLENPTADALPTLLELASRDTASDWSELLSVLASCANEGTNEDAEQVSLLLMKKATTLDKYDGSAAIRALFRLGSRAAVVTKQLEEMLVHKDYQLSVAAHAALAAIGIDREKHVSFLIEQVATGKQDMASASRSNLRELPEDIVVPYLQQAMKDKRPLLRAYAFEASTASPKARELTPLEMLLTGLSDESPQVRLAILFRLKAGWRMEDKPIYILQAEQIRPALEPLLSDPDKLVNQQASIVWKRLGL